MDKRKPSDVFLELWRARELQTPEAFRECAETWLQIRELEKEANREFFQSLLGPHSSGGSILAEMAGGASPSPTSPPETAESTPESTPADGEKVHESTPAEGVQNGPPARDNAEIGRKAFAERKKNDLERLEALRDRGVSMQDVADAAPDLQLYDVLRFLERKPLPLPKLAALEKALKKLEG